MNPSTLTTLPPEDVRQALKSLSYREREILKLIAGVGDGYRYTSEEVAQIFKVDRATIKLIVENAMLKVSQRLTSQPPSEDSPPAEATGLIVSVAIPEYCDNQSLPDKLVELYVALNGMHIGAGGGGLIVNEGQSSAGVATLEGSPVQ